jgi:hypothetical protein
VKNFRLQKPDVFRSKMKVNHGSSMMSIFDHSNQILSITEEYLKPSLRLSSMSGSTELSVLSKTLTSI